MSKTTIGGINCNALEFATTTRDEYTLDDLANLGARDLALFAKDDEHRYAVEGVFMFGTKEADTEFVHVRIDRVMTLSIADDGDLVGDDERVMGMVACVPASAIWSVSSVWTFDDISSELDTFGRAGK